MHVICYLPEQSRALINDLATAVNATGGRFDVSENIESCEAIVVEQGLGRTFVFVTTDLNFEFLKQVEQKFSNCSSIVLLNKQLIDQPTELRYSPSVVSFFPLPSTQKHSGYWISELMCLFLKINERSIFGLDKLLAFPARPVSYLVFNDADKRNALNALKRQVMGLGENLAKIRFEEYASRLEMMVDELVLNAVFNANPSFRGRQRGNEFSLTNEESVLVSWGFDGKYFGFSVVDRFGLLERNIVLNYLDKTLPKESVLLRSSGGMGLRFVFERVSHLHVNVSPSRQTEIVGLLCFEKRLRDIDSQMRSFSFFKSN